MLRGAFIALKPYKGIQEGNMIVLSDETLEAFIYVLQMIKELLQESIGSNITAIDYTNIDHIL